MTNKLWTRSHRKQSQSSSTFGGWAHALTPTSPLSQHSQSQFDSRSEVSSVLTSVSSRSHNFFRSRSQKSQEPYQNKIIRSLHRANAPSTNSVAEYPETAPPSTYSETTSDGTRAGVREVTESYFDQRQATPTNDATRAAETPEGLLITQALASGQALHQLKSASPPSTAGQDDESVFNDTHMSMSSAPIYTSSKTSSDSGTSGLDRWPQRRLGRIDTEQGYRERRQGSGQGVQTPSSYTSDPATAYTQTPVELPVGIPSAAQHNLVHQTQPQQSQLQGGQYPSPYNRTAPLANSVNHNAAAPPLPPPPNNPADLGRSAQSFHQADAAASAHVPNQQSNYSPESNHYQPHNRPGSIQQSRSFSQNNNNQADDTASIMSAPSNAPLPAPKPVRSSNNHRQSMHNGTSISPSAHHTSQSSQQQAPPFQAPPPPPQQQQHTNERQTGNIGRATPQPQPSGEEMSGDEINQLLKEHKELREKYTKVKKYYFEKEEQVKQLQNTLAHQRLAQSRTSLDDSEYSTRLMRLDGLISQLAFNIRKSWKAVPLWLAGSVNKDAIQTGKQEMTAAGRAFISCWLVDEVFEKYFHPDLEPTLSAQLKNVQKNIRRYAPPSQTMEEEEGLWAKIANWRLATLDGLQDVLRSGHTTGFRAQLMDILKEQLIDSLQVHLSDPPMSDLEGGVNMIIELAVSMQTHIPLESRDVSIDYYMPGTQISNEVMKVESGIPALGTSVAEDAADRMSLKSSASDDAGGSYHDSVASNNTADTRGGGTKRGMLAAFTGVGKKSAAQGKNAAAAGSTGSLGRPESAGKDERSDKVRMSVGLSATVRGKNVLVKAPVFGYV